MSQAVTQAWPRPAGPFDRKKFLDDVARSSGSLVLEALDADHALRMSTATEA